MPLRLQILKFAPCNDDSSVWDQIDQCSLATMILPMMKAIGNTAPEWLLADDCFVDGEEVLNTFM